MTPTAKIGIAMAMLVAIVLVARAGEHSRDDRPAAAPGPVPIAQVSQRLESQGYRIRKIEEDDGRYKVIVLTADRHKEKFAISPRSGAVIGRFDDYDD